MKARLIEEINVARSARRPVCLVTELANGEQWLTDETTRPIELGESVLQSAREALSADRSGIVDIAGKRYFLQCFAPGYRLIIVGAVHITQAMIPMACTLGYDVAIVDPRRAFASEERFPNATLSNDWPDEAMEKWLPDRRTAVVTLTHDPKLDDPALISALRSPAYYIGALGSRKTHAARLARLRAAGFKDEDLARIHGPAGIDIGAKSPAEIALSVLAEMTVDRHGRRRS